MSCKQKSNPAIQASFCTPCLSKWLRYQCLWPCSWKLDHAMNGNVLYSPAYATAACCGLASLQRRGWWHQWVATHSASWVCPAAWRGWARPGLVATAPRVPHPSCCREPLHPCSLLWSFAPPLMHPVSSGDSFSLLIWQKKDVTSCWMSLCQVNELNLSTGLSSEWEDQQQEHTAWQGRVLWGRHPILAAGNC